MSGKAEIDDITVNGNGNTSKTVNFTDQDIIKELKK
jgi:hypothetical protein